MAAIGLLESMRLAAVARHATTGTLESMRLAANETNILAAEARESAFRTRTLALQAAVLTAVPAEGLHALDDTVHTIKAVVLTDKESCVGHCYEGYRSALMSEAYAAEAATMASRAGADALWGPTRFVNPALELKKVSTLRGLASVA